MDLEKVNQIKTKTKTKIKIKIKTKKKITKIKLIPIIVQKTHRITKLKVFLNSVFNQIKFNFFSVIRSIFYFLKGITLDFTEGAVTNKRVYFLPFILTKFNPNINSETEPIISYSFAMFILSLIVLICFYNIVAYILSIYLLKKYDVENKFPIFKKYIKFYSSSSKYLLVLEIIIAFVFLLCIVAINFFLFTSILMI